MGILQVVLFGRVRATHDDWLTEVTLTQEIQALLAYLLLQRRRIQSREVLAAIFWAEQSQQKARASLNTALWKLKKALEPEGISPGTYLRNARFGEVGFNSESRYWLDVEVFEEQINLILDTQAETAGEAQIADLNQALGYYQGELLEGFYKDWALRERERLRALFLKGQRYLMHYYRYHQMYENELACGQQILALDPLHEDIHREIMRVYWENGQRALAVRQYEMCRAALDEELGILPMQETRALYEQIRETGNREGSPLVSLEAASIDDAVGKLKEAGKTINLAGKQIYDALQIMTKRPGRPDAAYSPGAHRKKYGH
jgi:DNA-binding SARP family transcriptional activator